MLESIQLSLVSIIAITIMIGSIFIAYFKKMAMTYALIFSNFIVFFITVIFPNIIYSQLGFRPIYLFLDNIPMLYTLFTSMFVHGGFAHIIGNMLVFFFIGMAFEQRIGWKNFITIYILTGICGALTHSLINIGTDNAGIILIGASGAIFGVMGAFAYSYPRDEVVMPIPLGIIMVIRRVKVIYAVLIFAALETIIVLLDVQDTTAHFAHLGGLVSGVIFAAFLIRNKRTNQTSSYTQPIHYETSTSQNQQKFDITNLKKYATTTDLKKELKMIENENVPQVRDVWIEHFLEKAKCPKCKKVLKSFNGKIWCENCGYKSNY